ncbi:uncharacterized protein LODBEIA_P24120 [Lodderomyces beijingensis]|uniref:Uncharacterized protein n=1 Tax=Lodderomyces beijingensis TaxID=1775926 RepID=A0ABP0ZJ66_9ASCO
MSSNEVQPSANFFANERGGADLLGDSDGEDNLDRVLGELGVESFESDDEDDNVADLMYNESDEEEEEQVGKDKEQEREEEDEEEEEDDDDEFLLDSEDNDDYNDEFDLKDAIKGASNFNSRRNKRGKPSDGKKYSYKQKMSRSDNRNLDPEVRMLLSQANEAFVRNDFQVALGLYKEVIKHDARNFSAYKAIGEIYQSAGNLNDCCNSWLLAANIHPWDHQFWGQVAELSADLGHIDQAIYCYTRAISSDANQSAEYLLRRALLFKEKKQYGKALDGFRRARQVYPTNSNIFKYIAAVYAEQKRLNDAINLYMKMLDWNINHDESPSPEIYPTFGWTELNILLELHVQHHSYRLGINVMKLAARWIQGRANEDWDDQDDSEFDVNRRFKNAVHLHKLSEEERKAFNEKPYDIPVDIRFKMGVLRLGAGDKDEALHHFEYLLDDKQEDIEDLYFEAGRLLEEMGLYEEALVYLLRALGSEEPSVELVQLLGKCYYETEDYAQAKEAYEDLLKADWKNVDYKLALAETLHHLGDDAQAERLIIEVQKESARKGSKERKKSLVQAEENLSLIRTRIKKTPKRVRLTELEKEELEMNAKRKVLDMYGRMERLEDSVDAGDKIAISAWIQLATQLVEMFTNVKTFFPKDKMKKFKGIVKYRGRKNMDLDEKLARAYNLLEGISQNETPSRSLTSKSEYRGLTYHQWFDIFAQLAFLVAMYEKNVEYADEILSIAMNVSLFHQDKKKEIILQVLKVIQGIVSEQPDGNVQVFTRHLLSANQFSPFMFKFYICCYASGLKFWQTFASYNQQKYFLRQLKAYDSSFTGKYISGMSTVSADLSNVELGKCHADLTYIYANLLGGNRSYASGIFYLNRAYEHYNRDPMICLMLGLGHVHRSMQRMSANRHNQLLQGISYLLEYQEHRSKNATIYEIQEIQYNFGRLFHTLGLSSLAIPHYDEVLKISDENDLDPDYDLAWDAAYNLTLIYNLNGNAVLARELSEKYLVM